METDGSGTVNHKSSPFINESRCSGCGRCIVVCEIKNITLKTTNHHKIAVIYETGRCTNCRLCIQACPIDAIQL